MKYSLIPILMNISFVHLRNFRKLKDRRIEFSMKETIFVLPIVYGFRTKCTPVDFTPAPKTCVI